MQEYDRDKMQLLVKRMTYTMFSKMYYLNMAQIVMVTINIMAILPLTVILIVLTTKTATVIKRREKFWENPERLKKVCSLLIMLFSVKNQKRLNLLLYCSLSAF